MRLDSVAQPSQNFKGAKNWAEKCLILGE